MYDDSDGRALAQLKSSNLENLRTSRLNDSMLKTCVPPHFVQYPTDVFVMPHETAVIEARILAIPDAEVKWFKDWVPINDGQRLKIRYHAPLTYMLKIENVTTDDAGSYTCVARNCFGSIAHSVNIRFGHLEIKECPRFLIPLEATDIIAGRKAQLEVKVRGVPKPEVKWYKNWIPIQDGGNIQICQAGPDHYVLKIYDAQSTNSGVYTCKARNECGSVNTSAMIRVEANKNVQIHKPHTKITRNSFDSNWSDALSSIRFQLQKLTEDFEQYEQKGLMHEETVAKLRLS